jgi:hypothetical protein
VVREQTARQINLAVAGRQSRFRLRLIHEMSKVYVIRFHMTKRIQNIVVTLLLVSYLFVGAAAHLDALNRFLGVGEGPHKVGQTRPIHPLPTTVCWTQYKHIPAVTKIAPAPPAVVSSVEPPRLEQYILVIIPTTTSTYSTPDVSPFSSRAPPLKHTMS